MPLYRLADRVPQTPATDRYWVAPDANVIGSVILAEDVGIWFGAKLRGDNDPISIGRGTNIQDGVMVHSDLGFAATIGEMCTIGHHAIIHGCTIGDNSLVGMGATILNGANIGRNCTGRRQCAGDGGQGVSRQFLIVGSPARAVRTLDDEAVASIRRSAENYIENWKRFRRIWKSSKNDGWRAKRPLSPNGVTPRRRHTDHEFR